MARRRRVVADQIDRAIELEIRRGIESETQISRIKDIEGTTIKVLSPMSGQRPREIRAGAPLIIHEETKGAEPRSYEVAAGPDPNNPEQPHQYYDEEEEQWILVVQQPDDLPIKRRSLVRAKVTSPVVLKLVDDNGKVYKEYGEKANTLSIDLSGSGMLLSVDIDDINEIPRGTKVILEFQLPDYPYTLPPIKGSVVRIFKRGESRRTHAVGIEFDEFEEIDLTARRDEEEERVQNETDQQAIIRYVLKKQIEDQADLFAEELEEEL